MTRASRTPTTGAEIEPATTSGAAKQAKDKQARPRRAPHPGSSKQAKDKQAKVKKGSAWALAGPFDPAAGQRTIVRRLTVGKGEHGTARPTLGQN